MWSKGSQDVIKRTISSVLWPSTAPRVADLCRCRCVARRSKIPKEYSLSSRLAAAANLWQRTASLFVRQVNLAHPQFLQPFTLESIL